MKRIAQFEKVSFEQFKKDMASFNLNDQELKDSYDGVILPSRSTKGSAGYDFFLPVSISLKKNESLVIPTCIRAKIDEGWVLSIYPRSGLGFKYGVHLANTVGIIDSDYYNALNEGHIAIKITNNNVCDIKLDTSKAFAQGIFTEYGITYDDEVSSERIGGFGSTDKK